MHSNTAGGNIVEIWLLKIFTIIKGVKDNISVNNYSLIHTHKKGNKQQQIEQKQGGGI